MPTGSRRDESFTGVVYLKSGGITTDFGTLKKKRIAYVGEFGKVRFLLPCQETLPSLPDFRMHTKFLQI